MYRYTSGPYHIHTTHSMHIGGGGGGGGVGHIKEGWGERENITLTCTDHTHIVVLEVDTQNQSIQRK